MTLFERVRETAKMRGYSLAELAREAGIGEKSIYTWKPSKTYPDGITPKHETLEKIANVLKVSVEYLIGNTDNPSPQSPTQEREKTVDLTDPYASNVLRFEGADIDPDDLALINDIYRRIRDGKIN